MLNNGKKNLPLAGFVLTAVAFTLGCQNYPITLNGSPIKTPELLANFQVEDKHLAECLAEHIFDLKISKFSQLRQLNCAQRSIKSLRGIEQFPNLLKVNLSGNPIRSITPLLAVATLEEVNLNASSLDSCTEAKTLQQRGVRVMGICTQINP